MFIVEANTNRIGTCKKVGFGWWTLWIHVKGRFFFWGGGVPYIYIHTYIYIHRLRLMYSLLGALFNHKQTTRRLLGNLGLQTRASTRISARRRLLECHGFRGSKDLGHLGVVNMAFEGFGLELWVCGV